MKKIYSLFLFIVTIIPFLLSCNAENGAVESKFLEASDSYQSSLSNLKLRVKDHTQYVNNLTSPNGFEDELAEYQNDIRNIVSELDQETGMMENSSVQCGGDEMWNFMINEHKTCLNEIKKHYDQMMMVDALEAMFQEIERHYQTMQAYIENMQNHNQNMHNSQIENEDNSDHPMMGTDEHMGGNGSMM